MFLILVASSWPAVAADAPDWAYPALPLHKPSADPTLLTVPGSERRFTQGHIDDGYKVADWYPDEHPAMPSVVANGGNPPLRACAMCHLPNGNGHPESAGLAGLPISYQIEQIRAYAVGERTGSRAASMLPIAKALSESDMFAAAEYFAALSPTPWTRIVETDTVPQTRLGLGAIRYRKEGGETEPLGARIISVPEDDALGERRDSHTGFVEYVPLGSLSRGHELVERGVGGISCSTCHGRDLAGKGEIPAIAGRLALPTFRALNDIAGGDRTNPGAAAMRAAMPDLTQRDMIAVAAYVANLKRTPTAPANCPTRTTC